MSGLHLNKGENVLQVSRFYIEDFLPFCLNCFYNVKANEANSSLNIMYMQSILIQTLNISCSKG